MFDPFEQEPRAHIYSRVTASGIDPAALQLVRNDFARRAIARAETRAEAFALLERYLGPDGKELADADFTLDAFRDEQARLLEQERALQSGTVPPRDALIEDE
jgi:hypothetical protein